MHGRATWKCAGCLRQLTCGFSRPPMAAQLVAGFHEAVDRAVARFNAGRLRDSRRELASAEGLMPLHFAARKGVFCAYSANLA